MITPLGVTPTDPFRALFPTLEAAKPGVERAAIQNLDPLWLSIPTPAREKHKENETSPHC
jgi:hypothetical protein